MCLSLIVSGTVSNWIDSSIRKIKPPPPFVPRSFHITVYLPFAKTGVFDLSLSFVSCKAATFMSFSSSQSVIWSTLPLMPLQLNCRNLISQISFLFDFETLGPWLGCGSDWAGGGGSAWEGWGAGWGCWEFTQIGHLYERECAFRVLSWLQLLFFFVLKWHQLLHE